VATARRLAARARRGRARPDQRAARLEPGREAQPDRDVRRERAEPEIEQRVVGRERADDRERLVRRQRQRFAARGEVVAGRLCKTIFCH
jgi:hypothetical protein